MKKVVARNDKDEKNAWLENLMVMLQLRDRQQKGEQDEFAVCKPDNPDPAR